MAVPHRSDVPTFLAPAEARPDYARGQIVVRFHAEGVHAERATDAFDLLERQAGAHAIEPLPGGAGLALVHLADAAVSAGLLRTAESSPMVAFPERGPARWPSGAAAEPRNTR